MYLFMTLEVFLQSVAQAVHASGLIRSKQYGFIYALEIAESMNLGCDPDREIEVDCRELWREFFEFQEYREITSGSQSYADLARTILREVTSASVALDRK